jgi:hypothetical protein
MPELPTILDRAIGCSRSLIGKAAMPKRPRQRYKGADADVLAVADGEFAMHLGLIQRRGHFNVRERVPVIAAQHQCGGQDTMADQQRP